MSKFAVVVFPDERKAYEGVHAMHALHRDATVAVFGAVVVHRSDSGALSLGRRSIELPVGLGVLALAGGLVVLFGGPVDTGAFVFAGEGLVGGWRDHLHAGVSDDFLESVERKLVPGAFAIIAELSEESVFPLNTRMRALGGEAIRGPREDFVDDLLESAANVRRAELVARRAERQRRRRSGRPRSWCGPSARRGRSSSGPSRISASGSMTRRRSSRRRCRPWRSRRRMRAST